VEIFCRMGEEAWLVGDQKPGYALLYNMSQEELAVVKKYLEEC
jgi:hypothetical protein